MRAERTNRREFVATTVGALASVVFGDACRVQSQPAEATDGRLTARPRAGVIPSTTIDRRLGLDRERDAFLQMPTDSSNTALPLLILLHGASGNGESILRRLGAAADEARVAVLAPSSRSGTWDAIRGEFGQDVAFLDRALARVFEIASIDPKRIAVGGFSDGASYALSLGLINGDLFRRVVAFSPGFVVDGPAHGKPAVFISHGTDDQILPIDLCSRQIVPRLRKRGYEVTFREFLGGHEIPAEIARDAMNWVAKVPS